MLYQYRAGTPAGDTRIDIDPYPEIARSELVGFGIGSLDRPADFRPSSHGFADRQIPWLVIDDGLRRDHGPFDEKAEV